MIKKSRRRRMLKTAVPLELFFLVIALISGYFASPFSNVSKVTVHSVQNQTQLKNELPIRVGDSLIMIKRHSSQINDILQKNNFNFKNLTISWKNHNEAIVKVNFYNFNAYLADGKQHYAANARGEVSKKPSTINNTKNVVILNGFSKNKQIKTVLSQYEKLPDDLKVEIKEINNEANSDDPQKVKLLLKDGNQVILKNSELAKKMAYYPSIKTTLKRQSIVNLEYGAYATPITK